MISTVWVCLCLALHYCSVRKLSASFMNLTNNPIDARDAITEIAKGFW